MSNKIKLKKYYLFFMLLASDVPLLLSLINCNATRLKNNNLNNHLFLGKATFYQSKSVNVFKRFP